MRLCLAALAVVATGATASAAPVEIRIEHACTTRGNTITIVVTGTPSSSLACISYGNQHSRTDRCLVLDHARTVIDADVCPTWVIPAADGVALYDTRGTAVGALATDGWSWLTHAERRFALSLFVDPVDELVVMKKLVADGSLATVVPRLAIIARDAPVAIRNEVDAWILRTFDALGAKLDLAAIADYELSSLLGHAGDARLDKQAVALAGIAGQHDYLVDDIAADRDRAYALKLFGGERRLLSEHNYQLLHALEMSRLSVDLVLADPHLLDGVEPAWRLRVMANGCTAANRATLLGMFAQTAELPEMTRRCDSRVDLQRRLEPALRALIAPSP